MRRPLAKLRGVIFRIFSRWKAAHITIAPGLEMYKRLDIRGPGTIQIGRNCVVAGIPGNSSQFVTLYTLSPHSKIMIGDNAHLYAARVSCRFSVTIGDDVLIEEAGIRDTDFHSVRKDRGEVLGESPEKCAVVIGHRVGIGARSIVAKGVKIGNDTVIGPGSIVNRSLPDGCFVLGNPARVVER